MAREGFSGLGLTALALAAMAWISFLAALLVKPDPTLFFLALVLGAAAFGTGMYARRTDVAVVGLAAGQAAILATLLVAAVYATGALIVLVLLIVLFAMMWAPAPATAPAPTCSPCACPTTPCTCCDPCPSCCAGPGACDCGCGNCGGCGGCGGCGCAALVVLPTLLKGPLPPLLTQAFAHHPDVEAYREDVYRIRGARLCVGCFTTYPAFLLASAALVLLPIAWLPSLAWGLVAAAAQAVSSAGLARRRWMKATVKASLGVGLALVVHGVHDAPWDPRLKVLALAGALGLALASAIPRSRRMRKAQAACACAAPKTA